MLNINRIKAYEMGLVFHNGKLEKVLNEGAHWTFGLHREVYVYDKFNFEFHAPMELDLLLSNSELKNALDVFEVKEDEILIIKFHGNIFKVLKTGHHAFWKGVRKASFQVFNTANLNLITDISRSELETAALAPFVRKYVIGQYQMGLLYVDGVFKENLNAGTYYWWKNPIQIEVKVIESRTLQLDIAGQELLTKDKATLRVNGYVRYQITNALKAVSENKEYEKQLYATVQIVLRESLSRLSLDELLSKKDALGAEILDTIKSRTSDFGIEILEAAIRDVILPGEMREIMNQVLVAEKKAQANVITRREETASTRSMLNTAKLMDENPTLWKLKEMEYMEKIADRIGEITVSSNGNIISQLKEIFTK